MLLVEQRCTIEYDGASKGNPGRAGAGYVLREGGNVVCFYLCSESTHLYIGYLSNGEFI